MDFVLGGIVDQSRLQRRDVEQQVASPILHLAQRAHLSRVIDNQVVKPAFAGIIAAGVFTSGHVGIEGLDELVRICTPGGVIVLTVKNTLWEEGFARRIPELEAAGVVSRAEETEPYVSMPGESGTVPSRGLVLRKV